MWWQLMYGFYGTRINRSLKFSAASSVSPLAPLPPIDKQHTLPMINATNESARGGGQELTLNQNDLLQPFLIKNTFLAPTTLL